MLRRVPALMVLFKNGTVCAHLTRVPSTVVETGAHEYVWYVLVSAGSQKHAFALVVADDRHGHL